MVVHPETPPLAVAADAFFDDDGLMQSWQLEKDLAGKFLPVIFNGERFLLPWKKVSTDADPAVWIAFFDPKKDLDMGLAAACDLAAVIAREQPDLVIIPNSSRSVPMCQEAVNMASAASGRPITRVVLQGGYDENDFVAVAQENRIEYSPITAHGKVKFMGASAEDAGMIEEMASAGKKVVFVDDVYSTGATITAMKLLIEKITGKNTSNSPAIVAIYEYSIVDGKGEPERPDFVYALMNNPAIIRHRKKVG